MKIFIFGNYYDSLINFRGNLIKKLSDDGHIVYALSPQPTNEEKSIEELKKKIIKIGGIYIPINFKRHFSNPLIDLFAIMILFKELIDKKPNVIISYTLKPVLFSGLCIGLSKFFLGIKKIKYFPLITGLGSTFVKSNKPNPFIKLIIKYLYKFSLANAKSVIFQNFDDKNDLEMMKILPKDKKSFRVFGSGVDLNIFTPKPLPNKDIFLMIARLVVDKGVIEFLQAAKIVKKEFPKTTFKLVGAIDDTNLLPISIKELRDYVEEGIVDYSGELKSVTNVLNDCKYFVLPSYREGTPRSVLEAMATGRPIITTDVPGCRETVKNGYNGYLVKHKSSKSLANAMIKMLKQDHNKTLLMAERSLLLAKEFFVNKVNENIINIIK